MSRIDDIRMAAARAGVDPDRALVAGAGGTANGGPAGALNGLRDAWRGRRHLIVACGPGLGPREVSRRIAEAGVPEECPAMAAAGLGTDRERLLYGSLSDLEPGPFGETAVLVVPHPGALPVDFAWPPAAAPAGRDPTG